MKEKKKEWDNFIGSFKKLNNDYFFTILYDLGFLFSFYLIIWLTSLWLLPYLEKIQTIQQQVVQDISAIPQTQLESYGTIMLDFYYQFLTYSVLFIILIFLIWSVFRYLIYSKVLRKRVSFKQSFMFLLLNSLWIIFYLAISIFLIYLFGHPILLIFLFIVFIHFTLILYIQFIKKQKIKLALKSLYEIGIKKIHIFLMPYLFIILVFVALYLLIAVLLKPVPENIISPFAFIFFLSYLAWMRFYIADVLKKL